MRQYTRPVAVAAIVLPALSFAPDSHSAEWGYYAEYEPSYSSNVSRTSIEEIEEYINTLRAGVQYEEKSSSVKGRAEISAEYLDYAGDAFEDETRVYLNADLDWSLVRDRLFWVVENTLSNEPVNTRQPWVPVNIQQTNLFSTGPGLRFRFDNASRVEADVRYINSYAEITDEFDSDRWYLDASLIQENSILTDVSANLTWNSVDFDLTEADDYQRMDMFVAWDWQSGRSGLRMELGGSRIDFERADDISGSYARLAWNRQISSASQLMIGFRHGFADAAQQISGDTRTTPTSGNIISSQVYTTSELELNYRTEWARSILLTSFNYQKQVFLNTSDLGQELFNVRAVWSRVFSGSISTDLGVSYARTVYDLDSRSDNTLSPFFGVHFRRSSRISYSFRVVHENRDSSEVSSDYNELAVFAVIRYQR